MSKRLYASVKMFGNKHSLKHPVDVVARASGTGTETAGGVVTVVASDAKVYMTVTSGTNIGTLVGTA